MNKSIYTEINDVWIKFLMIAVISFFANTVSAQSFINNGALVTISANTTVALGDSVVNNGEITNNGTLVVSGIWQNNGTYNAGTGDIVMSSPLPQVINHNEQTLTKLTIAGGGDKFFEEDIVVADELVLEDGILRSVNGARIIVDVAGVIRGGSDASYIIGHVIHRGTGEKIYPVGTETNYLPFRFTNVEGENPEIGVSVSVNNPNNATVGFLDEVSAKWYWELDLIDGLFSGSQVALRIVDETFGGSVNQAVVAEARNLQSAFHSLGQSEVTGDFIQGSVTSLLRATGNIFVVGVDASITEPSPPLNVFNAVSPNGDNRHDFLKIENITFYPENFVIIYDRNGRKVYEISGYDNAEKSFFGESNVNGFGKLPSGTYYYWIDRNDGTTAESGFFVLNR